MRPSLVAFLFIVSCGGSMPMSLLGSELAQLARRIDHHINARLSEEDAEPAELLDAGGFLRRVTLDLAGRIPSVVELDAYLQSDPKDRKQQLVQRLIQSPDFAYHQRNQLDILLLLRQEHNDQWREYLLEATRENRPWDQLFREIMLPEDTLSTDPRPVAFLKRRVNDLDAMTNDSSVTWFGVNICVCQMPRSPAGQRLDAGSLLRHVGVFQTHVSNEKRILERAVRRKAKVHEHRRRGARSRVHVLDRHESRRSTAGNRRTSVEETTRARSRSPKKMTKPTRHRVPIFVHVRGWWRLHWPTTSNVSSLAISRTEYGRGYWGVASCIHWIRCTRRTNRVIPNCSMNWQMTCAHPATTCDD